MDANEKLLRDNVEAALDLYSKFSYEQSAWLLYEARLKLAEYLKSKDSPDDPAARKMNGDLVFAPNPVFRLRIADAWALMK